MFAHSTGYVSNDELVIFGGFNIEKEPMNFGFRMKLSEEVEGKDHEILDYGIVGMEGGGFLSNNLKIRHKSITAIQTQVNPKPTAVLINIKIK